MNEIQIAMLNIVAIVAIFTVTVIIIAWLTGVTF